MTGNPVDYWPISFVVNSSELVDANIERCFLSELVEMDRFYGESIPLAWRDCLQQLIGLVEQDPDVEEEIDDRV